MAGAHRVDSDIGPRPVFISDPKTAKGKASVRGEEGPALQLLLAPRTQPEDVMEMIAVLDLIDHDNTWGRGRTT
jgi:hypothetical protein